VTTGQVIASGTATLPVAPVLAGAAANIPAGTSLSFESPIAGVAATATVATGGIAGGVDEEGTEEVRDRFLLRLREPPEGGADQDYEAWALAVAGVTRAWVYPNELGLGTVVVRFVRDNEIPILPGRWRGRGGAGGARTRSDRSRRRSPRSRRHRSPSRSRSTSSPTTPTRAPRSGRARPTCSRASRSRATAWAAAPCCSPRSARRSASPRASPTTRSPCPQPMSFQASVNSPPQEPSHGCSDMNAMEALSSRGLAQPDGLVALDPYEWHILIADCQSNADLRSDIDTLSVSSADHYVFLDQSFSPVQFTRHAAPLTVDPPVFADTSGTLALGSDAANNMGIELTFGRRLSEALKGKVNLHFWSIDGSSIDQNREVNAAYPTVGPNAHSLMLTHLQSVCPRRRTPS
jgi:hypothetical protein